MTTQTLLPKILLFVILGISTFGLYKINDLQKTAFNDAKMESRFVYTLDEAKTGLLEFRLKTGVALDSNSNAGSILGYSRDEIKGMLLSNVFPKQIADLDFEKHPPTKVYVCEVSKKNGTTEKVYVRAVTSVSNDRVFFILNKENSLKKFE